MDSLVQPSRLDHVALWVADREALARFLCRHLGMHEIERTDAFTLVGADARLGKLTLFQAERSRKRGALERVLLRVADLDRALAELPDGLPLDRDGGTVAFDGPEGLRLGLVQGVGTVDYDLDHVVLRVSDPESAGRELAGLGFAADEGRLVVGDKHVRLLEGGAGEDSRPLLNHLALLVDSARGLEERARQRGLEVADVVDAPNTFAIFVWGPDRIKLEYVEHKPGFALV